MSFRQLESYTRDIISRFRSTGAEFCLIGGIAVSFRTVERTTKDIDLAVAVADDPEAEKIVRSFSAGGYQILQVLEHDVTNRLSTVRLVSSGEAEVFVDLLFASSGIEYEVVSTAEDIEIFPDLPVKVATIPSLIALKVLSADAKDRLQDIIDLRNLIREATDSEILLAKNLIDLITERGYNRKKDLHGELDKYISDSLVRP